MNIRKNQTTKRKETEHKYKAEDIKLVFGCPESGREIFAIGREKSSSKTMPSKLRKAIGAVKDQTSISLAKVASSHTPSLEVTILKATTHDEVPIDERYVAEIHRMISATKVNAAVCAQAIAKRIGKTKNWVVALKCLILVLRIFQDGDPFFPKEVLHVMKRGAKILNLSSFRDDSISSPWDYSAFVRTFALYLDERLDCFLTGKLQRRFTYNLVTQSSPPRSLRANEPVHNMKPTMLLDRIFYWQRLLDRAIATRPTGAAKSNRLVQIGLYDVVRESFDLYRDISDGLALVLDSFFHLQYQSSLKAFQACVKAMKQFEELCSFYDLCKTIGVGRTSEYPSVQKISDELVEALQEFLKDQASFTANGRSPSSDFLFPSPLAKDFSSNSDRSFEQSAEPPSERVSENSTSRCTSLEDLMSSESGTVSPSFSLEQHSEQSEKQPHQEDLLGAAGTTPNHSFQRQSDVPDLVSLDEWPQQDHKQDQIDLTSTMKLSNSERCGWEVVLAEAAKQPIQQARPPEFTVEVAPSSVNGFFDQATLSPQSQYNPFLQDEIIYADSFSIVPTFQPSTPTFSAKGEEIATFHVIPTFSAQNPDKTAAAFDNGDDPFSPWPVVNGSNSLPNGSLDQQNLIIEQQLWLQNQNKIIEKHMA